MYESKLGVLFTPSLSRTNAKPYQVVSIAYHSSTNRAPAHRRTTLVLDESKGAYDGLDQKRVYSYGADWRMLEERIDTDVSTNSDAAGGTDDDTDWIAQQFWGLRSIDDAVGKRVDRDADGDFVDADCSYWYQLSDTQFSVGVVLDWVG